MQFRIGKAGLIALVARHRSFHPNELFVQCSIVHSRAHVSYQECGVAFMLPQILMLQNEGAVKNSATKDARRFEVIYLVMDDGQVGDGSFYGMAVYKSFLASTI